MIEDVYEPLSRYRDEFRENFHRNADAKFEELVEKSGVDVQANRRTVAEIRSLQKKLDSAKTRRALIICGMVMSFIAAVCAAATAYFFYEEAQEVDANCVIASLVAIVALVLGFLCISPLKKMNALVRQLSVGIDELMQRAWEQMAPLNRLFSWDMMVKLIEKTVPRLAFDPYFTAERLNDMRRLFGWNDTFNEGRSVVFAQSGVINGNPFAIGELLEMNWGTKTYYGHLTISWQERVRDSDGKTHWVTRHETLTASVDKPIPVYGERKIVLYGNDAAPNLSFSREPNPLSNGGDGFFNRWKKKRALKDLEKFSRNLDDDSNFTLMGNHEFETLFHAKNRDNEVEFRLLFSALAQTQMLQLMKDSKVGFGDDFHFRKMKKMNMIEPVHLVNAVIDTDPERFKGWDFDAVRKFFMEFNEEYFKNVYFAMAPLLAIPLYQQTRTYEDIYRDVIGTQSSYWEHESIANWFGEDRFSHPQCITRSILKTAVRETEGDVTKLDVTAHGFRGKQRVDYVSVHGGDGNWHDVPVEWTEYLPVQNTESITINEKKTPTDSFKRAYAASPAFCYRRSIYAYFGK